VKKPYNIELSTERNQPVDTNIKLCQGDNNITFYINISDFDLTGNTVKIVFSQSNGISVENNAIVNSDKKSCTYNIVGNELQSPGKVIADLKIFDSNNKRLSSACFIFYVEIDSLNDGAFPPKSYSASLEKAIEECQEATQAALEAVQKVVNIANNDSVTEPGFAWDARRGKAIRDDLNTLNESLNSYYKRHDSILADANLAVSIGTYTYSPSTLNTEGGYGTINVDTGNYGNWLFQTKRGTDGIIRYREKIDSGSWSPWRSDNPIRYIEWLDAVKESGKYYINVTAQNKHQFPSGNQISDAYIVDAIVYTDYVTLFCGQVAYSRFFYNTLNISNKQLGTPRVLE